MHSIIAVTTGEPAGIGPKISLSAAKKFVKKYLDTEIVLFGDPNLLGKTNHPRIFIEPIFLKTPVQIGIPNKKNSIYVIEIINKATKSCLSKFCQAMVTAPVQKSIILESGIKFTGHTEYLAKICGIDRTLMMLVGKPHIGKNILPKMIRVAIVTTHIPMNQVSSSLNIHDIQKVISIAHYELQSKFNIRHPKIAVTGINPHAGESGKIGDEEENIIIPAIDASKKNGLDVHGPYSADTIFTPIYLNQYDLIIAMQHDQGLAPFKALTFNYGTNITLGLPIIRTSVDHGTALNIVDSSMIKDSNMLLALELAYQLIKQKL